LRVDLTLRHALPMANFKQTNAAFPLVIDSQTANEIRAHYEGSNVGFSEDFAFTYELKSPSNLSETNSQYKNAIEGQTRGPPLAFAGSHP
jgi:hypothetical protein